MSKPYLHAQSSAKRYGGTPDDYIDIHNLMDSSKAAIPSSIHRVLTHQSWFVGTDGILEKIFGVTRTNSAGKSYSVRQIGEDHILEDFGGKFIPTPQDYLEDIEVKDWMNNGISGYPNSAKGVQKARLKKVRGRQLIESDIKVNVD